MDLSLRENWRVWMLVALLILSTIALFPFGSLLAGGDGASDGPTAVNDTLVNGTDGGVANETYGTQPGGDFTNLDYGLDLAGGTRIRAPFVGVTAEISIAAEEADALERSLASKLGVDPIDVSVTPYQNAPGTVEVFSGDVSPAELEATLQDAGYDPDPETVRDGVTEQTRSEVVDVLTNKINEGGLTGGTVSVISTAGGEEYFAVVEVPGATQSEVERLIGTRGVIEVIAQRRVGNETTSETVLYGEDFTNPGIAQQANPSEGVQRPYVPVSIEPDAARNFTDVMNRLDFSTQGVGNCDYGAATGGDGSYCLVTTLDGEVIYTAPLGDGLAREFRQETFAENPGFVMETGNYSDARQLSISLRVGTMPTNVNLSSGTTYYLQPSLAERFKSLALVTGLVTWLAVSIVVFIRYRRKEIAIPMLATATAEVYLLLGFAASIGLALDLSHIAGFIAVIGTGVDDLVIIADEILQRGEIATGRVFQDRFRKAFWVIGVAAVTTIIAMSPLTVLSLGDLTGFAIVTIVGVLIGVLVTRPAYGDILRNLVLEE
ncbi:preprotein translocase subunit SecD [Halorhabdus amylolytica]|uniref:preprotein translocase subunit SecD n=1 Tax=Halorhabdus amylolytica TaxID=2559573 RepID=UPI0010AB1F97|nr:preprotein translocase subunit SecD [Halorhabdus amylolytica]